MLIALRIMGKGELSELQPFELVIIILISEVASIPMEKTDIPLINGIISIFTLVLLQILISYMNLKSEKARKIICGKPSVLIDKGKIVESELKALRININDLIEQLRIKNYINIQDVEYAILETNGELSVIPKPAKRPITAADLNLKPEETFIPISLIIDGSINYENLQKANKDIGWLREEIKKHNIKDIKDILYCTVDNNGKLNIIEKSKE